MRSKSAKKVADEDEPRSGKIRSYSSGGKRRRARRSSSPSPFPDRKRSKKLLGAKKSKSTKSKGGRRRRHRSLSTSTSISSSSASPSRRRSSSSSGSERSVSPPPRSRGRDVRKKKEKERGRDRKRTTARRPRRSRSSSDCSETSSSSRSRSRSRSRSKSKSDKKRRARGTRDDDDDDGDASRDKIAQGYDNRRGSRSRSKNSIEDSDRDDETVAVAKKRKDDIDDHEKNVMESSPLMNANDTEDVLPAGSASPEAEDLELILRQKALDNFRKFRGAAVVAGRTDNNGIGKDGVTDSPQITGKKIAEGSSMGDHSQRHRSGLGTNHSAGSARSTSPSWKQESSAGMSRGAGSSGKFESGSTSGLIEQKRSSLEMTRSDSQTTLQDDRTTCSVTQRLGTSPGSSASVKQRLGSSAGVSPYNVTPRVRSVVSIPSKEGLDDSAFITPPSAYDNSAPVESISEVRHPPVEATRVEGTNGDDRKESESSTPNNSISSTSEGKGQPGIDDKEGSEFEKKTFSRVHEGEAVQVSYKVYIPKKNPALARRKLQR